MQLDVVTIAILVLAVLALGSWGYGSYSGRPNSTTVIETAPAAGSGLSILGLIGVALLVAFFVMLATGWRFGFEVTAPR